MHQRLFLLVLLTLTLSTVFAQYSIRDPNAIPLHGEWQFALDPGGVGKKAGWYTEKMQNQRWDKVTVPHCFSADPRYQFYNGTAWYRRTFPWQPTAGKRVLIHFDGSFYKTTVYLNDKPVGMHEGGYTPFVIDLTDYIQAGTNTLAVAVDNDTWKPGTIPGAKDDNQPNDSFTGWINYGGLIRPVYLTVEPPTYIENLKVEATPDLVSGLAIIRVITRIRNTASKSVKPALSFSLSQSERPISLNWKLTANPIAANETGVVQAEATLKAADVKLWQLDDPNLYQLTVRTGGDTVSTIVGIRKVEVRNTQLLLNGQPIKVAGGNRVIDYPGYGSLEPDWLIEKDFRLMKEAGMEFHRLTHYTPSEYIYDLADRYGMLIISEVGNWQLTPRQMGNDSIQTKFRQQFREMVERDWNHPSVIAYSVGNEYQSQTPEGQNWTKTMIAYAREIDPTRLYTFATLRLNALPAKPIDEASQYCDFVSTNTYGNPAKVLDRIHELYPDKPIFISEYGQRADTPAGETGPLDYLAKYLAEVRKRPYVVGMSWWSFNDYQSRYTGTNPNGYRPWGLVNPDRTHRPLYSMHRREMAPLTLEKLRFTAGPAGIHELLLRITARPDFPAYSLRNYSLKSGAITVPIPTLNPGQRAEVRIPIRGFDRTATLDVLKPTGISILTETIDLK